MPNMLSIPVTGPVTGIIIPLTLTTGEVSLPGTVVKYLAKTLGKGSGLVIPASESSASGADSYLTWEQNDWKKIRYKISEETYEGLTGDLVSEADAEGGNASQLDLVLNDILSQTAITDHADMLLAEETFRTYPSLVVMDLGKGADAITRNDIGFAMVIGKMTSERKVQPDGATPYTMNYTFKAEAYAIASATVTALKVTGFLGAVAPLKGTSVTYPDITQGAIDRLIAGKWAIIK